MTCSKVPTSITLLGHHLHEACLSGSKAGLAAGRLVLTACHVGGVKQGGGISKRAKALEPY